MSIYSGGKWNLGGPFQFAGSGSAPVQQNLDSIDASGWSAQGKAALLSGVSMNMQGQADFLSKIVQVMRSGFDSTCAATTFFEYVPIRKRTAQPATAASSGGTVATTSGVALADHVFQGESIAGGTNNSTKVSPKPLACNSRASGYYVLANAGVWTDTNAVAAFHRSGASQGNMGIACVEFTWTDGVSTITQKVSTPAGYVLVGDNFTVVEFVASANITTLTNGPITRQVKVYPKVGVTASILDSSVNSPDTRTFCPTVVYKTAGAPVYAYFQTGGNDGTGQASPVAATAASLPFATPAAAANAAKGAASAGVPAIVRGGAGTFAMATLAAGTYAGGACFVFEGDPALGNPQTCIITGGVAALNMTGLASIWARNITVAKTGANVLSPTSGGRVVYENVAYDTAGGTGPFFSRTSGTLSTYIQGMTLLGTPSNSVLTSTVSNFLLTRGLTGGVLNSAILCEEWAVLGCKGLGLRVTPNAKAESGAINAFNAWLGVGGTNYPFDRAGNADLNGYVLCQNIIENTSSSSQPVMRMSGDGQTGSVTHAILWHNTFSGAWNYGRFNSWYDETNNPPLASTVFRAHTMNSNVANIHVSPNIKQDRFLYGQGNDLTGSHIGSAEMLYNVGGHSECFLWADSTGNPPGIGNGDRNFNYPGADNLSGAAFGATLAGNINPQFVDPKHTTATGTTSSPTVTAGAGGGDYRLQSGSPLKSVLTGVFPCPVAADGTSRAAPWSYGAY